MTTAIKMQFPGPGNYEANTVVGEGPKFIMGEKCGASAIKNSANVPGPGAYTPADRTYQGEQYSMGSKSKAPTSILIKPDGSHEQFSQAQEKTPGPGTYNSKAVYPRVHTGPRFGTEERQGMASGNKVPGPNTYREKCKEPVMKAAPAYGFGSSKRPQSQYTRVQNPGPGSYNLKGIVGTESQGKSLAQRLGQSAKNFNPGPGSYNSMYNQALKSAPGWRIGTSTRDDRDKIRRRTCNYPPPDSYNPDF